MSTHIVQDDRSDAKEDGEISDEDNISFDEVLFLSQTLHAVIDGPNKKKIGNIQQQRQQGSRETSGSVNKAFSTHANTPNIQRESPTQINRTAYHKRKRGQRNNKKSNKPGHTTNNKQITNNFNNQGNFNFSRPDISPTPRGNPSQFRQNNKTIRQQNRNDYQMGPQQTPSSSPRFPWMKGRFSANTAMIKKPSEENFEDLLKQHKKIQEQIALLEEEEEYEPLVTKTEDDSTDVEIIKVEMPNLENNQNVAPKAQTKKDDADDDFNLAELRRLALAAKTKTSTPTNKSQTTPSSNIVTSAAKSSDLGDRRQRQSSGQSKKKPSPKSLKNKNTSFNRMTSVEKKRRSLEERENLVTQRPPVNSTRRRRHFSEKKRSEGESEKRKRQESENQKREIQKILTLDDPNEQCTRFLKLLNHKRDSSKPDAFDILTNQNINYGLPVKKTLKSSRKNDVPLQDNYEEVEMDIDSNPNSPITTGANLIEEFHDADYHSAMQPVPLMSIKFSEDYYSSVIPEQKNSDATWIQDPVYNTNSVYGIQQSTSLIPSTPLIGGVPLLIVPPPPPPDVPPEPEEEPRPPLPPLEDDDEETALMREQLLKSLMEKRKEKEIKNNNVSVPVEQKAISVSSYFKGVADTNLSKIISMEDYDKAFPVTEVVPRNNYDRMVPETGYDKEVPVIRYDPTPLPSQIQRTAVFNNSPTYSPTYSTTYTSTAIQQVTYKPYSTMPLLPKHKPVVINMFDSSSEEDDDYMMNVNHFQAPPSTSLLGGLDNFLKEARKSVEVNSAAEKTKIQMLKVQEVQSFEKEMSKQREMITKDQVMLKLYTGKANKYLASLKTASEKVMSLREQLLATEKIARASKQQLEQAKKQAHQVKDKLLKRKEKLKELEEKTVELGNEVYGETYQPRLITVEKQTVNSNKNIGSKQKRKTANISITVNNDLAVKKPKVDNLEKSVVTKSKENAPPVKSSPKKAIAAERLVQEKKRLQQLEKEFAEKIRVLKESQAVKAIQTGTSFKSKKKFKKPSSPAVDLDAIKFGGNESVGEICLPKHRRRSLADMNSSTKPNVTTPDKHKPFVTVASADVPKPMTLRIPSGNQLTNLCQLQKEKIEKILKNDKSITWCVRRYNKQYPAISSPVIQMKGLDIQKNSKPKIKDTTCDFTKFPYTSLLLQFQAYRLSSYFRTKENKSILSSTYSNKVDINKILCRYDLQGKCNDDKCQGQHIRETVLSEKSIMEDIVSNCPKLAGITKSTPITEYPAYISKYVDGIIKQHGNKMTNDQICLLLISKVNETSGHVPPFTMFYESRKWRPTAVEETCTAPTNYKPEIPANINTRLKSEDNIIKEEDIRYFIKDDNEMLDMESGVLDDSTNIPLWIKLAYKKLNDSDRNSKASLDKALNVLARGIESNKTNSDLWYHYLLLYKHHVHSEEDIIDIYNTALQLSPSYNIYWMYLESSKGYNNKDSICDKIIEYLTSTDSLPSEQRSHYLLEIILYKVTLAVQTGRFKTGLNFIQSIIKVNTKTDRSELLNILNISDKSVLWISYMHLLEYHHLPSSLYSSNNQNPGHILDKSNLMIEWRPVEELLTSVDVLIEYFWQAVEQCSGGLTDNNPNLLHCQNIFDNFVAFMTSVSRWKDATEVCRKVLQLCPSAVDMWLTAANLYASCGEENIHSAQSVFEEAIKENHQSAKLFNHLANFDLLLGNHDKALEVLERYIMSLYDVTPDDTPDPNVLYCFILGLPLPFSTRLPLLQQSVSNSQITQDKVYLWLNYCLLLELQGDSHECNEMYETAVSSTSKSLELCKLWVGYAEFVCRQINPNTDNPGPSNQLLHLMTRSITSMPTKFYPAWCEDRLQVNYNHVNGLIDYYLCRLPTNDHMTMLEKYHHMMPDNMDLLIRTCEEGLKRSEYYRVSSLTNTAVYDQVANIDFWKMVVSLKLKEGRNKEVKKFYQKSVEALPYAATLWKDFLLFEVTQKDEEGVKKILRESEEYGLNIKGFVATISS